MIVNLETGQQAQETLTDNVVDLSLPPPPPVGVVDLSAPPPPPTGAENLSAPAPQVSSIDRNREALHRRAEANGLTVVQQLAQEDAEPLKRPAFEDESGEKSRFREFGEIALRNAIEARANRNTEINGSSALRGAAHLMNPSGAIAAGLSSTPNSVKDDLIDLGATALGWLQSAGLLTTTAGEAFVGNPLHDRVEKMGGTPEFADAMRTVGTVGTELVGGVFGPRLVKRAADAVVGRQVKKADAIAEEKVAKLGPTSEADKVEPLTDGDFDTVFSDRVMKNITQEAASVLSKTPTKTKRQYLQIADALRGVDETGARVPQIDAASVGAVIDRNGMDLETFVQVYKASVSGAGRTLARQSHTSRQLSKVLVDSNPELATILSKNADETSTFSVRLFNAWRETDIYRRLAATGQVVTAARNVAVSVPISALQALDNSIEKVITGGVNPTSAGEAIDTMGRYIKSFRQLKPANQKALLDGLDKTEGYTLEKLTGGVGIADASVDNTVKKVLSFFNRMQEKPLRMAAAEFKLLDMKGVSKLEDVDFKSLTPEELDEVTDYALTVTFAKDPDSQAARRALQSFTDFGGTTIAPYPRFMFYNAPKWFLDHSPLGAARVMMGNNLDKIKAGDTKNTAKILSESVTGTIALSLALTSASGEQTQEAATEDGGRVNLKTFAPLSIYDAVAKAILDPSSFEIQDVAQMLTGMRSDRDTPLEVFGEVLDGDEKGAWDAVKRVAGNYVSMFTIPLRQAKDIVSIFDPEEAVSRDSTDQPVLGRTKNNIPFLSQTLPTRRSMFETGVLTPDKEPVGLPDAVTDRIPDNLNQVVQHVWPLTKEYPPEIEKELLSVGIQPYKMYPRTGVDEADDYIVRETAKLVEQFSQQYMWSDEYTSQTTKAGKALALKEQITAYSKYAKQKLQMERPDLYGRMRVSSQLTQLEKEFFEQSGGASQADINNFIQHGDPLYNAGAGLRPSQTPVTAPSKGLPPPGVVDLSQ